MKKYYFALGLAIALVFVGTPVSAVSSCDPGFQLVGEVCIPSTTGLPSPGGSGSPVALVLSNFMQWLLTVFGMIAVIGFVVSGIQYLTSTGDEARIESAKRHMKWSIVGVIVALSGVVIIFAVDAMLNANAGF